MHTRAKNEYSDERRNRELLLELKRGARQVDPLSPRKEMKNAGTKCDRGNEIAKVLDEHDASLRCDDPSDFVEERLASFATANLVSGEHDDNEIRGFALDSVEVVQWRIVRYAAPTSMDSDHHELGADDTSARSSFSRRDGKSH